MINAKKQELLQRGNAFFPIQYYLSNTANPLYNLPLHWHFEMELIHIVKGSYTMFVDNSEKILHENDMCLITGGILHGDGKKIGKCLYESVVFDPEMIRIKNYSADDFISQIVDRKVYMEDVIPSDNGEMYSKVNELFTMMRKKPDGYELFTTGILFEIMGILKSEKMYYEKSLVPTGKKIRSEQLKAVLDFIQEKYSEQLTLEQMAETADLSPKYFCRVFREMTHHTPVEYLNLFRINNACNKLRNSDDPIIEIAYSCGFNDFSYFIKIFKRYKGMTPFKYRNYEEKLPQ